MEYHPRIVFVDSETTSLDDRTGQVTELAWCHLTGPSERLVLPHFTHEADQQSLDIQQHHARELWDASTWASREDMDHLRVELTEATLAGANVGFDLRFLSNIFHDRPWHYRTLDVEAYAAGALGWECGRTLSDTAARLRAMGFTVHHSDHTAQHDVLSARDVYIAARTYAMESDERRAARLLAAESGSQSLGPEREDAPNVN
jgi:oligoribonuclease (3'-5' exoribonuclease)